MMCTTVLHGGVCHRTSTPHKSGIKMKEKKKIVAYLEIDRPHGCSLVTDTSLFMGVKWLLLPKSDAQC